MTLAAALCALALYYPPACARGRIVAPIIMAEHRDLDPLLVGAVLFVESSFDQRKVGRRGEIGIGQIKPDGWGARLCRDAVLSDLRDNIRCAIKLLRYGKRRCGGEPVGSRATWLGWYNSGHCGPSRYAAKIAEVIHGIFQETVTGDY